MTEEKLERANSLYEKIMRLEKFLSKTHLLNEKIKNIIVEREALYSNWDLEIKIDNNEDELQLWNILDSHQYHLLCTQALDFLYEKYQELRNEYSQL